MTSWCAAVVIGGEPRLSLWILFAAVAGGALVLDLGLSARRGGHLPVRSALAWSAAWVAIALGFAVATAAIRFPGDAAASRSHALYFLTSYVVELSLSVDNLFVFIMLFTYFAVPDEDQPRVLKWGILGAVVLRGALIAAGTALIGRFGWVRYLFGPLLIAAAWRMLKDQGGEVEPGRNPVVRAFRLVLPVVDRFEDHRFFVRGRDGFRRATALLVVLITIETTDVVFALDSIPAVLGITHDFFIAFTSNIFAVLGLRALFFVLIGFLGKFRFLKAGVAAVLVFVGAKMLLRSVILVPIELSLATILGLLTASVFASVLIPAPAKPTSGLAGRSERNESKNGPV